MTTAPATTAADVVEAVRDILRDCHPGGVTLEVIGGDIRRVDEWWRVPVRPSAEPPHTFEYYDALAVAEGEINEKTGLKVLLVPDREGGLMDHADKKARRRESHVAPLAAFVDRIRTERCLSGEVVDFDPDDGGVDAEALFVMESPGPKAVLTGFVSRDNPDQTARNMKRFLAQVGIARERSALWNVVPWHLSADGRNANPAAADVRAGLPYLRELLLLLPRLRAVVLVGAKAQSVREHLPLPPSVRLFQSPHAGLLFVNRHPENAGKIQAAFQEVAQYLRE